MLNNTAKQVEKEIQNHDNKKKEKMMLSAYWQLMWETESG